MDEKELKNKFMDQVQEFGQIVGRNNLRIYAIELPTHSGDKTLFADIVLEDETHKYAMDNDIFVLEFKDKEILHSALDQLNLYCDAIPKQLYRKGSTIGVLISSKGFSEWEIREAKKQGRLCALYDGQNMKLI